MTGQAIDYDEDVPDLLTYWSNQREASIARGAQGVRPGSKAMGRHSADLSENAVMDAVRHRPVGLRIVRPDVRPIPARLVLAGTKRQWQGPKQPARILLGVDKGVPFGPIQCDRQWNVKDLLKAIAHKHRVRVSEIKGQRRAGPLVAARQEAMFVCRALTNFPYPVLGRLLGGRDHTTVMHGVRRVAAFLEIDFNDGVACADAANRLLGGMSVSRQPAELPDSALWLRKRVGVRQE